MNSYNFETLNCLIIVFINLVLKSLFNRFLFYNFYFLLSVQMVDAGFQLAMNLLRSIGLFGNIDELIT